MFFIQSIITKLFQSEMISVKTLYKLKDIFPKSVEHVLKTEHIVVNIHNYSPSVVAFVLNKSNPAVLNRTILSTRIGNAEHVTQTMSVLRELDRDEYVSEIIYKHLRLLDMLDIYNVLDTDNSKFEEYLRTLWDIRHLFNNRIAPYIAAPTDNLKYINDVNLRKINQLLPHIRVFGGSDGSSAKLYNLESYPKSTYACVRLTVPENITYEGIKYELEYASNYLDLWIYSAVDLPTTLDHIGGGYLIVTRDTISTDLVPSSVRHILADYPYSDQSFAEQFNLPR